MAYVCLDPGHGYNTSGKRSPDGTLLEYEFNQVVADKAEKILQAHGVKVLKIKNMKDADVPLLKRTQMANNAKVDLYLSIHANAHINTWSSARGFEVYHYPNSATGKKLAVIGHKHGIAATKIPDRGIKTANFVVIRETNMPAILFEFAFFTNKEECALLKTEAFRTACAIATAKTALEWFGIPYKATTTTTPPVSQPKPTPTTPTKNTTGLVYEVEKGDTLWGISQKFGVPVAELRAMNKLTTDVLSIGKVLTIKKGSSAPTPTPEAPKPTPVVKGTPILGQPELSAHHLNSYVKTKNPNAPEIAEYFIELGKKMGIRGDIAFCQSLKETGYFKFGGDVLPSQNNYSGLGTTGGGVRGAYFDTPRQGVLAQLQHLWAYATNNPLPAGEKLVDPRFDLVSPKGKAPTWESLAGKWAVPGYDKKKYSSLDAAMVEGETYGQQILDIFESIKKFTPPAEAPKKEDASDDVDSFEEKDVFYTYSNIDGAKILSVVIDGKGYVRVSDIASYFNHKALFDNVTDKILIVPTNETVSKKFENPGKKVTVKQQVYKSITVICGHYEAESVTIEGKGFVRITDIAEHFDRKVSYDTVKQELIFVK